MKGKVIVITQISGDKQGVDFVEKSAYDKAVEALKAIAATPDADELHIKAISGKGMTQRHAEKVLKELGELE